METQDSIPSLYQRLGGEAPLERFVQRLYFHMANTPETAAIHGMHAMSIEEASVRLFRFLSGMLGGPPLFHEHYGEPFLRRRHLHLEIGDHERDQWMYCAARAAQDMDWDDDLRAELLQQLKAMADHMRNMEQRASGNLSKIMNQTS